MDTEKLRDSIAELMKLDKNWDGYNSSSFDKKLADWCHYFLDNYGDYAPEPVADWFCPISGGGSTQIEWDVNNKCLEIEIYSTGQIGYLKCSSLGEFDEAKAEEGKIDIREKEKIKGFFDWLIEKE